MFQAPPQPAKPAPKELGKLALTAQQIGCLRFSPCGKLLAAGDYDAKLQLWRVDDAALAPLPAVTGKHNGYIDALAFAPRESMLFTADTWGRLSCWHYSAWLADAPPASENIKPHWSHDTAHDGFIRQITVSSDGKHLATCGRDQVVRLWSLDGKLQRELKHGEDVYAVAFSPDSSLLVSGDLKGIIRVWSMADGKEQRQMDASSLYLLHRIQDVGGARVLAFSRDGDSLYCGGAVPKGGGFVEATPKLIRFDFKTGRQQDEWMLGEPKNGFIYEIIEHREGELMLITSGQPGQGQFMLLRTQEREPAFVTTKMANCHALTLHPDGVRCAIAATNGGSNANGRERAIKNGVYTGNHSPIHLWSLGDAKV